MTIYVAEIEGRAIAAFHAETDIEAEEFVDAEWFRDDLMVLEFEGRPLWNGTSEIYVREAVDDERATWDSSRARGILEGEADKNKKDWLAFLVLIVDPTDDD
jgi:hypothetical protein